MGNGQGSRWLASLLLAAAIVCVVPAAAPALAQAGLAAPEYRVKAAFVYRFGDYIEWPPETFAGKDSPLRIGVLGADELADELTRVIADRPMAGRPVQVLKMRAGARVQDVELLFVGQSALPQFKGVVAATQGRPVLIITESPQALNQGSAINFVIVDSKVRFDIALPAAEARRIKISSRLLAVARKVRARPA